MRTKIILLMGGMLFFLSVSAFAAVDIATYSVDGFDSDNLELGATFEVTVTYTNNTGAAQTIVGALFYFNYDTDYLDVITDEDIVADNLSTYLTSKTNPDFTPAAGQFRYQRDAGAGTGLTVADGGTITCFTVQFHIKQDVSPPAAAHNLFSWVSPDDENVVLTVAGGTNITGTIGSFQAATLKASHGPTFSGLGSVADAETGNTLTVAWPYGASLSADNHDNDSGTLNDTSGAETNYSNHLLKHRVYRDNVLVHTSATAGEASWQNSSLNDMQAYAFKVEAIDNCSPTPNQGTSNVSLSGTPHDYTAPGASISITSTLDQQINLSWSTADSSDLGGYIVVRKEAALDETVADPPTIAGASGNSNGTSPTDAKTQIEAAGWTVVYEGASASLSDTGLDNSKRYHYWVYAYDKTANEGATDPVHQGYNYSMAGTSGVPGAAPGSVSQFRALSNLANGITLNWLTSDPPNYAGARVVHTTDYAQWTDLSTSTATAIDHDFTGATVSVTETLTREGLDVDEVYYFAIFSYNSSKLLWSDAVYTAAVPGGVDVTEVATTAVTVISTQAVEVNLVKKEGDYGINDLIIPFSPLYVGGTQIANLKNLVDVVNFLAGEIAVTAAGVWDEDNMELIAATFDAEGKVTYISEGYSSLEEVLLGVGDAAQVSVTKNVSFSMKNYE